MRLRLFVTVIGLALVLHVLALASANAASGRVVSIPLSWQRVEALPAEDRTVAEGVSQQIKSALEGTPFGSSFWTPDEAALLPTGRGEFLFIRYPSTGNCADFQFYVFAPPDTAGRRKLMFGGEICVGDIRIHRTGGPVPDLVIPSETTAGILRWRGTHWDDPTPILLKDYAATHGQPPPRPIRHQPRTP